MKKSELNKLREGAEVARARGLPSVLLAVDDIFDLINSAEYAHKAEYILESLPVGMEDMLDDYDPEDDDQ